MQDKLLGFQAAAVKIAARIVMQKGGAMIGDVVGLGKTLVGTAVARLLQEEQGFETLVVCPKNLTDMWESYLHEYEVRGKVESLSMVHKNLPNARRYRLVIIDEAHNLRSDRRRDHGILQSYIADNDSKTLLLTATPYNKELGDLASQLALFIRPDTDLGLRPERAIAEVGAANFELMCNGLTSTLGAFKRSEHLGDGAGIGAHRGAEPPAPAPDKGGTGLHLWRRRATAGRVRLTATAVRKLYCGRSLSRASIFGACPDQPEGG